MTCSFRFLLILIFLQTINSVRSQEYSLEYGRPNKFEAELKEYPADKMAEAIVIYDIGKTWFMRTSDGFQIVFERRTKIKVLSEPGVSNSEIAILFYRDNQTFEKIADLEGKTYNLENGLWKVSDLDTKQVYEEKVSEHYYELKFAMPAVKPGSIIEYKYTLQTPRIFYLRDWDFQCNFPTVHSEYEIRMIPFYQYTWLLQGASKFHSYTETQSTGVPNQFGSLQYYDNIITYIMKNVPAFRDEEFITSVEDYLIKIDFQLSSWTDYYGHKTDVLSTWPALCKDFLDDPEFGKYVKTSAKLSAKYFNYEQLSGMTETEKFKSIIQYVKSNFNWNSYSGYLPSKTVNKFLDEKTGSVANINLYLCGMLQAAGLKASPVLISTRDNGKVRQSFPFASFFNYVLVIVTIDGIKQLADATDTYLPDLLIPQKCLNDKGLIVQEDSVEWALLSSPLPSVLKNTFRSTIPTDSDSIIVDFEVTASNYEAARLRKKFAGRQENLEEYILDKNLTPTDSISVENYDKKDEEFRISCKATYLTEKINGKIYFSPFFEEPMDQNLFTQPQRSYPIDLEYPRSRQFISHVTIPEGYKIEFVPSNLINNGKLVAIKYAVEKPDNNTLVISGSYTFNKAVYEATDYLYLKFYCNEIVKKFNEKIVLVEE
jgi:hypothetical protein